jgi:hypothetical protein
MSAGRKGRPAARRSTTVQRRKLNLKAEFESSRSHLSFNTLSSGRFQLGFDRVNLHRSTTVAARMQVDCSVLPSPML